MTLIQDPLSYIEVARHLQDFLGCESQQGLPLQQVPQQAGHRRRLYPIPPLAVPLERQRLLVAEHGLHFLIP